MANAQKMTTEIKKCDT